MFQPFVLFVDEHSLKGRFRNRRGCVTLPAAIYGVRHGLVASNCLGLACEEAWQPVTA